MVCVNIRPAINNTSSDVKNGALRWSLRLIGSFELGTFPGGQKVAIPGKRERALLAFLALSPKGRQPRRRLAALLWGDSMDETLLDNLRTCVWRLRKALGDTEHRVLASDEEEIVLDIAAFDIDVLAFHQLAAQTDRSQLEAATKFCSDKFLEGLELDSEEFESWRRLERSRHLDQAVDVLTRLMSLMPAGAQGERALAIGSQILTLDPLHEATVRHLMRLYADNGRRGAALQLYRTLSDALHREVNTQPEAETRKIFHEVMQAGDVKEPVPSRPVDQREAAMVTTVARQAPSNSKQTRHALITALMSACIACIALISYWWISQGADARIRWVEAGTGGTAPPPPAQPVAMAVLPFENLSSDPAQQFFSDGMSEEISAALAKVPGLELIARTSAFQFRGNKDARQVGKMLGARYVLEGAVRKKDDRVRITAQLVRTDTGRLVWSDSYERQLTDVFTIQENIAKAIAAELRLSIALPRSEKLVSSRDIDAVAYEQFLRAKPLVRARSTGVEQAIQILEPLVAHNPRFAPAWALLAQAYDMMPAFVSPYTTMSGDTGLSQRQYRIETYWPKAEAAARRAILLDPKLADGYLALGLLMHLRGKLAMADDLFAKASLLDRYSPDALGLRMNLLADVGELRKAGEIAQELVALDPYVPTWKQDAAEIYWAAGRKDTALQLLAEIKDRPSVPSTLAMIYSADGRFADAADVMEAALKARGEMPQNQTPMWRTAVAFLRTAPAKIPSAEDLPRLGRVDFVYLHVGQPEQALEVYESEVRTGLVGGQGDTFAYLWHPSFAAVRHTARFKTLMLNAGMVGYWRQRGWPQFCRPRDSSDFECQ